MSEHGDYNYMSEPEDYDPATHAAGPMRRALLLRIASGVALAAVAGGVLLTAYVLDNDGAPRRAAAPSEATYIPVRTVMTPAPEQVEGPSDLLKGLEATGMGFCLGLTAAFTRHRRRQVGIEKLDGSHDRYDDPLDRRLFEGYCQRVTKDIVWVNERIVGSDSVPFDRPDSVE